MLLFIQSYTAIFLLAEAFTNPSYNKSPEWRLLLGNLLFNIVAMAYKIFSQNPTNPGFIYNFLNYYFIDIMNLYYIFTSILLLEQYKNIMDISTFFELGLFIHYYVNIIYMFVYIKLYFIIEV